MDAHDLANRFEDNRSHLLAVAYRMLGSETEAEDAVQETWLRLNRSDGESIENLRGWLTTVTARVCLDHLRSRKTRHEQQLEGSGIETVPTGAIGVDPEAEALLADSVGLAMLVVLDTLTPAERVAFVLHDTFGLQFDEIAPIVGRTPVATRQLASRARRRVRGAGAPAPDTHRKRAVVNAFLAASRHGDFDALLALLAPDVILSADESVAAMGVEPSIIGARGVAARFGGGARALLPALLDGDVGLVWMVGGAPKVAFTFELTGEKIVRIDMIAAADRLD